MKKLLAIAVGLVLVLLALPVSLPVQAQAPPVTIDFEDLSEGQFVGTHYPGLDFSPEWRAADCTSGPYNCGAFPPHSWPTVLWTGGGSDTGRIDFLHFAVSQVGAWLCAGDGTVYLEAYDAVNNLVASGSVSSGTGYNAYLSVTDPQCRIRYVVIHDGANVWTLDDFEYTQCRPPSIPTLSLWGTAGMTVVLAGFMAWRLRRTAASL